MSTQTDRTRILTGQACPRKRFWEYHYQGVGISKIRKSLPLVVGSAFHEGAEDLLLGKGVESAVARAIKYLDETFAANGVELEQAQTAYAVAEQTALVEALLRGWWTKDGENFLAAYEVVEVEKEGRVNLAENVVLMYRPDALVRDRMSGDYYVISWKTASSITERTTSQMKIDMQSMSEVFGEAQTRDISIEGVLYLFASKGRRAKDDYLGMWVQDSPLIYGWKRSGPTPDDDEWAWKWRYPAEDGGAKQTQLGKGFRKVPIWSDYPGGVRAWIAALGAGEVTPRHVNALDAAFPTPLPVERRADEIDHWRRQIASSERSIASALEALKGVEDQPQMLKRLDAFFPQHTARCFDYGGKCAMYDICFTPAVASDPIGSGLYQLRVSNHPEKGDGDE